MISICPKCQKLVSIPSGIEAVAIVRCPLCEEGYSLGEALALVPPELIVVPPARQPGRAVDDASGSAPEPAEPLPVAGEPSAADETRGADQPVSREEVAGQHEEANEATAAAAGASPMPSATLKRRRRTPSGLRRLIETVIGALVGFLIAYYAWAICLGPRRFQEEVIQRFGLPQLPFISAPAEPPAKSPAKEPDHTATEAHSSPSN